MKAYVLLEDGTVFTGASFGHDGADGGELVFNTAMTGYQEVLTDPSYTGQIVCMTSPMIGNYGVNPEDVESGKIFAAGFVVRECAKRFSNFRASESLGDYLIRHKIVGVEGVDTRAITRRIRERGSMRAMVGTESVGLDRLRGRIREIPDMTGQNLAIGVATEKPYTWETNSRRERQTKGATHVVVIDCGVKRNILRRLVDEGARVTVVPPTWSAADIERLGPDGLLVSNGPGDPDAVPGLREVLRALLGKIPIFGICLGHQLLGLAVGARTHKLKFGHHGANHPVRNEKNQRIEITSQNHGFAVDPESLARVSGGVFGRVEITHVHLSDGTVEGFELPDVNARAIQYHPEANPGPHDASYLFTEFLQCIRKCSSE